jgi:membrane-associated protein
MFVSGVFVATGKMDHTIFTVCSMLILASVAGNVTGYLFGRKAGPILYGRKDSKFFKQQHLNAAKNFYKKHGGLALTAGSFIPIIRTFAPIVAGIIKLNFRSFILYTITGSFFWILSFVLSGYMIGSLPFLRPYLKYIIIGIIILVTTPVVIRVIREFNKSKERNDIQE